jgi:hypothetical protein
MKHRQDKILIILWYEAPYATSLTLEKIMKIIDILNKALVNQAG